MSEAAPETAFLDLEFPVEVWLASERIPIERLLRLEPGGLLKLAKGPDEPVDLVVNGTVIATGELVVVDGHFGFRVSSGIRQRLAGLGGDGSAATQNAEENSETAGEPPAGEAEKAAPDEEPEEEAQS